MPYVPKLTERVYHIYSPSASCKGSMHILSRHLIWKIMTKIRWGYFRDGPWPDPTPAYFWPTVNKRPTCLWPRYFLTRHEEIFFDPKEKLKNFTFLRGNFPNSNPNQEWLTQPNPTRTTKNWPDPLGYLL